MQLVIKFLGALIIAQAAIFILRTDLLRQFIAFIAAGSRIYLIGALRIALAVLLFVAATQCRRFWIIIAVAAVFLISGIAVFSLKAATIRKIVSWYQRQNDLFLRLLLLIAVIIGAVILYAA